VTPGVRPIVSLDIDETVDRARVTTSHVQSRPKSRKSDWPSGHDPSFDALFR